MTNAGARALYAERVAAGVCVQCGRVPAVKGGRMCAACGVARLQYRRAYDGCAPWAPGRPGRPPIVPDSAGVSQQFPSWIRRGRSRYGLPA